MKQIGSPFLNVLPSLDVHGYTRDTVIYPVSDFINDNLKLKNDKIVIIHGKGLKVLSSEIKRSFLNDKRVKKLYISSENVGCTIIELNI
jgi:DNA-nicking Smr family endonuclease